MHYRHDPSKPHGTERDLLSPASRGRDDNAQRGDPAYGGHTAAQRQSWGPTQAAGPKARAPALTRLPTARDSWWSGWEQAWRPVLGARFGCGTSRAQARGLCLLRPVSPVCPFCCLLREASRPAPPSTPGAFWPIFQPSLPFSRCLTPSTHLSRRRALGPEQTQHGPFWETWQVPTRHFRPGSSRNWSRDKGAGTRGWAGRWQSRETRRGRGKVRREEGGPPG